MTKTYHELSQLKTFEERFEYLRMDGRVGESTFGYDRYLNQMFYRTPEWKRARRDVILRDNSCDLGMSDREIHGKVLIHHLNPITKQMILDRDPALFDPNNLICCSHMTHDAIHYGDGSMLPKNPIERTPNDTCLWK